MFLTLTCPRILKIMGAMYPQVNAFTLLAGPGAIALCVILTGAFPILRIRRLEPVAAMGTV